MSDEVRRIRKRTASQIYENRKWSNLYESRLSRASYGKKKSTGSRTTSVGSENGTLRPEYRWLKAREFLLLLVEAALAVASKVIQDRIVERDSARVDITEHEKGVRELFNKGFSTIVSMFIGCLADSYFEYYTVALFSVIIHFVGMSAYAMEEIIKWHPPKGNPYDTLVWTICSVTSTLIKSTDFTRLVYALEGMTRRKKSTIYLYIFLHFWVSSYATYGGILTTLFSVIWEKSARGTRFPVASFGLASLSLFIFVYFLEPEFIEKDSLGCRVVGCFCLATFRKIFHWNRTYDKTIIFKTKEILRVYVLLLPSFGIVLTTMLDSELFYEQLILRLQNDDTVAKIGVFQLARLIIAVTMPLSYFVLWPLLSLIGLKKNITAKFLLGHILLALSMFYAAILFKTVERFPFDSFSGLVRIFNTRNDPVILFSEDESFTSYDLLVGAKEGVITSVHCDRNTLFPMKVVFNGTMTNFTTFLSVSPGELTGYVIVDPPRVIRIRGPYLPLREGPPGTNNPAEPRIFFYSTAAMLKDATVMIDLVQQNQDKEKKELKIRAGTLTTISLKPGTYQLSLLHGKTKKIVDIKVGGFYGVLLYVSTTSRELVVDEVVPPSSFTTAPFVCRFVIEGLADGLGYPSLRGMIYFLAPNGLLAMSFAFLAFLEGISFWIQFTGFKTWHYFVTADVLFAYACLTASFFLACMFVASKYIKVH